MGANFRGKALKLIFVLLNFVTATSPGMCNCTSGDDTYSIFVTM